MVTEKVVMRVALLLSLGVEVTDIRDELIKEEFSEYNIFLAVKAGETYNLIDQRTYTEES